MSSSNPTSVPDPQRDVRISKSLSKLLRHQATKDNLPIDSNGFVVVSLILRHNYLKSNKTTLLDLQRVVKNDNKQRYTLEFRESDQQYYICANQGHTIKSVQSNLIPLKEKKDFPTQMAVHGTSRANFELIKESGYLSKMKRNHIHFAMGLPEEKSVISGMRNSSKVLLFLDIDALLKDGYPFWRSVNDVILSEGKDGKIPLKYFRVEFR